MQILLEVNLCKDGCRAKIALDDFRIASKSCVDEDSTDASEPLHIFTFDLLIGFKHWTCGTFLFNFISEPLKIRLVNGSSKTEGRLEVLHDGRWGTVCSQSFGKNDSRVVCRMLGFR